jgi:hypothetical protein
MTSDSNENNGSAMSFERGIYELSSTSISFNIGLAPAKLPQPSSADDMQYRPFFFSLLAYDAAKMGMESPTRFKRLRPGARRRRCTAFHKPQPLAQATSLHFLSLRPICRLLS